MIYTEDYNTIPTEGWCFYNDEDETVMELYYNGNCVSSQYITDYCDVKGLEFQEDKCLVYDTFIGEHKVA